MKDVLFVAWSKWFLRHVFGYAFEIEYVGLEHIPASGPALVVPNHQSYLDPLFVGAALKRSVRYMAMRQLFAYTPAAFVLRYYGAFPVAAGSGDKRAFKTCLEFLRAGELVMVFPEGERSYDGSLNDFFQGFARIALRSEVPVIPVTIRGAIHVWPRSRWLPRFGKVRLIFHAPLHPADFAVAGTGADFLTARVRATMEDALGPGSAV